MKNKGIFKFAAGFLCGALLFGAVGAVFAAGVAAGPKTAAVVIDGQTVDLKGYVVEGAHYFGLRDISEKLKPGGKDFGVTWDGANNRILIDTGTGYGPEAVSSLPAQSSGAPVAPEGVLTVPNNGDKRFVPKAGDRVLCDDGSVYEITRGPDLNAGSGFTANGKRHPGEALPEPTCDWSVYPDLPLPDVEVKRFQNYDSQGIFVDDLYILNLHEMRRVQYTLYNHILPETQRYYFTDHPGMIDSLKKLGKSTDIKNLVGQVRFGYLRYQTQQGFYPWDENEVIKQVRSVPTMMFCVEVWDVYHDGYYTRTEYKLQTRQRED